MYGSFPRESDPHKHGSPLSDPWDRIAVRVRKPSPDPATDAIYVYAAGRIQNSYSISRKDVSVQFGEVKIAGKSYICAIQSVAVSSTLVRSKASLAEWEVLRILDVGFTNYHKFGSTVTVLPGFSEP